MPLDFNSTAQLDNSTAQLENSTAQLDNSTAQLDNSTAQLDNSTTIVDSFTGPFPDCSGWESRLSDCPEINVSNSTECLSTNVICQSPGKSTLCLACSIL